jgi:hypothetical protein
VRVTWEDGRIRRLEPGPAFRSGNDDVLRRRFQKELVESPRTQVATAPLFSSPRRITGRLRVGTIQLMPPSAAAPKSNQMNGHPFHLQFPVRVSENPMITAQRRARGAVEHALVLNALLRGGVHSERARTHRIWALCNHDPAVSVADHSHWVTEGYIEPGIPALTDYFAAADLPAIPVVPHAAYYDDPFLPGGPGVVLPDSLPRMLETVERLDHENRRRFMRAAQWLSAARNVWDYSASSYYIAIIAAIEALQGADDIVRCSEWDQVRGVTRRFRDFVDRFAPPEDSEGITRGRLYAIRSDLAHGRVLFDLDEAAPWSRLRLTPNRLEQDEARDMLARLVKRVIIGWVLVAGG